MKLSAHPESFQLEKNGSRVFVNLPKSEKVGVVDRKSRSIIGAWSTGAARSNYPMALDEHNRRLFVVTRDPAKLLVLNTVDGREVAAIPAAGDCDDVFLDERRAGGSTRSAARVQSPYSNSATRITTSNVGG